VQTCLCAGQRSGWNIREWPSARPIGHATGTSPAVTHDGWHLGALVLVIMQRATRYESVTVRCSRQSVTHMPDMKRGRVRVSGRARWWL
jgi:hypothetical protein